MMNNETIRVGIVGAGKNTRDRHIPGLRAMEAVEIVSVANSSRESSLRVAEQLNIPKVYDNWRNLVYAEDTNAIVIGTWPYMHHPVTLAALDAGKHVMVEARMAINAAQAREMAAAARLHPELVTQIVPSPMTLPMDNTIKRLIAAGYLGEIVAAEVRSLGGFTDFDTPIHWRQEVKYSGLNIMSVGIWYEAVLRWIGPAKTVTAVGKTVVKSRKNEQGHSVAIDVPDHLNIVAEMVNGAQMHMTFSAVAGLAADASSASLFGTEGTLQIRDDRLYGGKRGDTHLTEIDIPDDEKGGWRVEEEFIRAIRGLEQITHTDFDTGVAYMEFTEAIHRSMADGKTVTLPLMI